MWRLGLALLAAAATAVSVSATARSTAGAQGGLPAFLRIESSAPVFDVLYRYGQVTPAPDGAYPPNTTDPRTAWYLEYQRAGAVDVIDGALRSDQDPTLVATGLRMFHFGLARQAPNGSFPGSAWPFHGTALFLSEAAPALLILRSSSLAARFAAELHWEVQRMRKAALYMVRAVGGAGKIDDATKNHRFYEAAIALGAVGLLAGDATLIRWSKLYVWKGIRMERATGVMPEDGGHDTGYQALGMSNAARYLELLATGSLRTALYHALARGENWELSRVRADGSVNQAGDTRTVGCRERDPRGRCKTVFYAPIFDAFARWGAITSSRRFTNAAHAVWVHSGYGGH